MNVIIQIVLPVLLLLFLVFVVAFFSSSETAYLSIPRITIRQLLKKDPPGVRNTSAQKISSLKNDMDTLLSLILIGINFISTLASSIATALAIRIAGEVGATYATIIMVFVLITFGEIIPKTIASVKPVPVAVQNAGVLTFLKRLLFPVVWFFTRITSGITSAVDHIWKSDQGTITEDELKTLIAVGEHEGTLEQSEKNMLYKIFAFTDLHVYDIMRHRSFIQSVSIDASYAQVLERFCKTGYSRLPVYSGEPENIVGILNYKTVLFNSRGTVNSRHFVNRCLRPVLFIPESLTALELLQKFKKEKANFAIAVDETGANCGMVTMDDLLRAVFGRSVDEYPSAEIPPEKRITVISSLEFIVPGDLRLYDVNELLDLDIESENYDTLGGWLLEQFDALPASGETIKRSSVVYKVEDQSKRRIQSVRVRLPSPLPAERSAGFIPGRK
jgi:putative hemolysin